MVRKHFTSQSLFGPPAMRACAVTDSELVHMTAGPSWIHFCFLDCDLICAYFFGFVSEANAKKCGVIAKSREWLSVVRQAFSLWP